MFIPAVPIYRRRRNFARREREATPPVLGPVLVEALVASYEPFVLRLAFDRDINIDAIEPGQFVVDDASGTGFRYVGSGVADTPDPQSVELDTQKDGAAQGTLDVLNAGAGNGIVAADDDAPWPGVSGLELPYSG